MKCPCCGEEMEDIDSFTTEYVDVALYQCPKCKTIRTEQSERMYDDTEE